MNIYTSKLNRSNQGFWSFLQYFEYGLIKGWSQSWVQAAPHQGMDVCHYGSIGDKKKGKTGNPNPTFWTSIIVYNQKWNKNKSLGLYISSCDSVWDEEKANSAQPTPFAWRGFIGMLFERAKDQFPLFLLWFLRFIGCLGFSSGFLWRERNRRRRALVFLKNVCVRVCFEIWES